MFHIVDSTGEWLATYEELKAMFEDMWPKALQKLKEITEK
jgi:hypothetical protein